MNIANTQTKGNLRMLCLKNRKQEAGESLSAYVTEWHVIAKNCAHDEITPDESLRDCLVLGV